MSNSWERRGLPWSCDTFVALPDVTANGTVMLGKNSDRPVFDCQPLVHVPRQKHTGGTVKLSYIEIPQVDETYATIGSSPYWCWGYEEGINEFGVAIGNEAIFTKDVAAAVAAAREGRGPREGLLGMELLRLGLERGRTAREALEVITSLVEEYGQWGSGVPGASHTDGAYDNSYIIADPREAWVLETVGKKWIAKRLTKGYWAISNEPSIRNSWDLSSETVVDYAIEQGWWPEEKRDSFDFAFAYTDFEKPLQVSHIRAQRMRQLLRQAVAGEGEVSFAWMKRILRDHYEDTFLSGPYFNAALPDFLTICMHSSPAGFTWGNTASSAIFILPRDEDRLPLMWWTPLTPCTGLYLPVFVHAGRLPEILSQAGTAGKTVSAPPETREDTFREGSYWWLFRDLLETIKGDEYGTNFTKRQKIARAVFDELEAEWWLKVQKVEAQAVALRKEGKEEETAKLLASFTSGCVKEALAVVEKVKGLITSV